MKTSHENILGSGILLLYDPADKLAPSGYLKRLLTGVNSLTDIIEIIIIVNHAKIEVPNLVKSLSCLDSTFFVIKFMDKNSGVAAGYNAGISLSSQKSNYVVLISTDSDIVQPSSFLLLAKEIHKRSTIGLIQPSSVFEDVEYLNIDSKYGLHAYKRYLHSGKASDFDLTQNEIAHILKSLKTKQDIVFPVNRFGFTFLVIKKCVFEDIGIFDENFQYCFENVDFLLRALHKGWKTALSPNVFVNHRRPIIRELLSVQSTSGLIDKTGYHSSEKYWYSKWSASPDTLINRRLYGWFVFYLKKITDPLRNYVSKFKNQIKAL